MKLKRLPREYMSIKIYPEEKAKQKMEELQRLRAKAAKEKKTGIVTFDQIGRMKAPGIDVEVITKVSFHYIWSWSNICVSFSSLLFYQLLATNVLKIRLKSCVLEINQRPTHKDLH